MNQVTKLRGLRGVHRGAITKLFTKIDTLLVRDDVSAAELPALELCKTNLEKKLDIVRLLDSQLIGLIEDETELETDVLHASDLGLAPEEKLLELSVFISTVRAKTFHGTTQPTANLSSLYNPGSRWLVSLVCMLDGNTTS